MTKKKSWAIVDLSDPDSLYLEIDVQVPGGEEGVEGVAAGKGLAGTKTVRFAILQFVSSFAINEVPQATCTLAVGTNIFDPDKRAEIHDAARSLNSMLKARVLFFPQGEISPDGKPWGVSEPVVIFEGKFTGFAHRKVNGSVAVSAQITHWLSDLSASSAFSSFSHPSTPASMVFPSLLNIDEKNTGKGGLELVVSIPDHLNMDSISRKVKDDLWSAIKEFLYLSATSEKWRITRGDRKSHRLQTEVAVSALKRIEGPIGDLDIDGNLVYSKNGYGGKPLTFFSADDPAVANGVAKSFRSISMAQYGNQTLWDILVGHFCKDYGLSVVPQVDKAVVVAHTPGYSRSYSQTLSPSDYHFIDYRPSLSRPLRGVFLQVHRSLKHQKLEDDGDGSGLGVYGQYFSNLKEDESGTILVGTTPSYLKEIEGSGVEINQPGKVDAEPRAKTEKGDPRTNRDVLYQRYAKMLYLNNRFALKTVTASGRLRFDIAPGCHIKIESAEGRSPDDGDGKVESAKGGAPEDGDGLATNLYGQVTRVTVTLDKMQRTASTSFQLSHVRNEIENTQAETVVNEHMLFGDNVVVGVPLVEKLSGIEFKIKE